MSVKTLEEIERAVSKLSPEDFAAFRAWFAKFDADIWDQEFEADVTAGKLDALANKALRDLKEGRCTEL